MTLRRILLLNYLTRKTLEPAWLSRGLLKSVKRTTYTKQYLSSKNINKVLYKY